MRGATGPGARCYNGLAALGDELWVVGGCCSKDGIPNNRTPLDSVVVYDTVGSVVFLRPPPDCSLEPLPNVGHTSSHPRGGLGFR